MNIKTEIEIVTGFLGSGKTTFINALLKNTLVSEEIILIIQCESGETQIKNIEMKNSKIITKQLDLYKSLTASYLKQMIEFYNPHRIIIEYNGTKFFEEILKILNDGAIESRCRDPIIYYLSGASTFQVFYQNMKELTEPYIINSNLIVLNNCSNISRKEEKTIVRKIEQLNPTAIILTDENLGELDKVLKKAEVLDSGITKKLFIRIKNRQVKKAVRSR